MTGITASPSVHCHLTKHHHQHTTQWLIHLTTSATLRLPFNSDDHEQTANILSLFLGSYYHHEPEARRWQGTTRTRPWNTMTEGHGDAIMEEHKVTMEHDDRRASEAVWNLVAGARDALGNFLSHSTNFYWLWNRLMLMPKLMVQLSLPWHIHFCILYVVRKFSDNFMIR